MSKNYVLTRRDFVRGTVSATLAASLAGSGAAAGAVREPRSARVVLVRDENALGGDLAVNSAVLKRMIGEALAHLTGEKTLKAAWLSRFREKDVIGLVPTPHLNPTHRELTALIRESLVEAGFAPSQIRNAQGGPDTVRACTALISLPGLKAHWLTGIGTVLKNYIMYSGKPSAYHHEDSARLGEIWNLPHVKGKTRLILVDALRPLCDKGPQPDPRYLWPYRGLLAGFDPVAVEAVGLKIINEKREAIRGEPWPLSPPPLCLEAADSQYNLGTSRLEEINLEKVGWDMDILV
jgi:hypothetical protein